MRSLFFKIFLWFWPAMILVAGAAAVSLEVYLDTQKDVTRTLAGNFRDPAGFVAVEALEKEGPAALRQHLERWNRYGGFRAFVFDEQGVEASGQEAPPEAVELARHARATGSAAERHSEASWLVASHIAGRTGRKYVFVASLPNRERGGRHRPFPTSRAAQEPTSPPDQDAEGSPFPGDGGPKPPGDDGGPPPFPMGGPLGFLLEQPRSLVLILSAVVLMSGIVCYGLARYLTRPLRQLGVSARRLAEGDLAVRVGAVVQNRHDEIGALGRDFDFMAERIESLVSAQRRLLRDMSHELRSPLARLHVALGLARQRTGPEAGDALNRIELEAQRLNELIGELLELVRLDAGSHVRKKEPVNLGIMVQDIAADAEFEAKGCGREVKLLRCDDCTVMGVPELLRSAVENVVRNAIRYTPEGASVDISLAFEGRNSERTAVVRVRDYGSGVPEESIQDIFRPFYRVGDDRNRQTGGVGLGLAIAQQAMRLHDGEITAANAADGGLLVKLSLPAIDEGREPGSPAPDEEHQPT